MRYFAAWGHTEFVLCLGYKGDVIKEYFLDYNEALFNDFVLEGHGADARVELLNRDVGDWRITFVDTGMQSTIGERLKAVEQYLGRRRGRSSRPTATASRTRPRPAGRRVPRIGKTDRCSSRCTRSSTPTSSITADDGTVIARRGHEPLRRADQRRLLRHAGARSSTGSSRATSSSRRRSRKLIPRGEVIAYPYDGFFGPMDTIKDRQRLEALHESGERRGSASGSARPTSRGPPDARPLALRRRSAAPPRARDRAVTPTTSRSAAAGRSSRSRRAPPDVVVHLGRPRAQRASARRRRARAPGASSPPRRRARRRSARVPGRVSAVPRRCGEGRVRGAQAGRPAARLTHTRETTSTRTTAWPAS